MENTIEVETPDLLAELVLSLERRGLRYVVQQKAGTREKFIITILGH